MDVREPPTAGSSVPARTTALVGAAYATAAFLWWGLAPLYWRAMDAVPAGEMLAHRVVWALPVMLLVAARGRRLPEVAAALRHRGHRALLLVTSALVGVNWGVFIWAIQARRVLESSLGYYMTPLLNVALGVVVLRERLSRGQAVAVTLAAAGVAFLTAAHGSVPVVALVLASTFALYGLLRKRAGVDATVGLTVETLFLAPLGAVALVVLAARGEAAFPERGLGGWLAIAASGVVTSIPLLWFSEAARRLRLTALGFFQYLAPTAHLLLAIAFGEPFTAAHGVAFGCIWAAILVYALDAARPSRIAARGG